MGLPPALRGRSGLARALLDIDRRTARQFVEYVGAKTIGELYHRCLEEGAIDYGTDASSTAALQQRSQQQHNARQFLKKEGRLDEDASHHIAKILYSTLRSIEMKFGGDESRAVEACSDPDLASVLAELSFEENETARRSEKKIPVTTDRGGCPVPQSPMRPAAPRPPDTMPSSRHRPVRPSPRTARVRTSIQAASNKGFRSARYQQRRERLSDLPVVDQWMPRQPRPLPASLRLPFVAAREDEERAARERQRIEEEEGNSPPPGGMLIRVTSSGPTTRSSRSSSPSQDRPQAQSPSLQPSPLRWGRGPSGGSPRVTVAGSDGANDVPRRHADSSPNRSGVRVPSLPVKGISTKTADPTQETDQVPPSWISPRLRQEIESGRVSFRQYHLNKDGFEELLQAMRRGLALRSLTLLGCGVTPGMGRAIATVLPHCPLLGNVCLAGNALDDTAATSIIASAREVPRWTTVDLSDNPIGDTRELARALWATLIGTPCWAMLQALEAAAVARHAASPTDLRRVPRGSFPASMAQLREISFAGTRIGDTVAVALGWALPHAPALKRLHLRDTRITWLGARVLLEGVRLSASLEQLDIGGCCLGEEGGLALAEALAAHSSLQLVHADRCDLNAAAGFMLAEALRFNSTLKGLALDQNPFGLVAAKRIFAALRGSTITHTMTEYSAPPQRRPLLPRSGGELRTTARQDVLVALIRTAQEQMQSKSQWLDEAGLWTPTSEAPGSERSSRKKKRQLASRPSRSPRAAVPPVHPTDAVHGAPARTLDPDVFQFGDQLQYRFDHGVPDGSYSLELHRFRDHCLAEMLQHRCRHQRATWRRPRWEGTPVPKETIMAGLWEVPRYGNLTFEFAGAHAQLEDDLLLSHDDPAGAGTRSWRRVRAVLRGVQTFRQARDAARNRRKSISDIAEDLLPLSDNASWALLRFSLMLRQGTADVDCMRRLIARHRDAHGEEEWDSIRVEGALVTTRAHFYDEAWISRHSNGTNVQVDVTTSTFVHRQRFVLSLHRPRSRRLARFLLDMGAAMDTTAEVDRVLTTDVMHRIRFDGKPVALRDWRAQTPTRGERDGTLALLKRRRARDRDHERGRAAERVSAGGWTIPTRGTFSCELTAHCAVRLGSDRIRLRLDEPGDRKRLVQAWTWGNAHPDVFLWDVRVDGEPSDAFGAIIGRLAARMQIAARAPPSSRGIFAAAPHDWTSVGTHLLALYEEEKEDREARRSRLRRHKKRRSAASNSHVLVLDPASPWWERALPVSGTVEFDLLIARPLYATQSLKQSLLEFDLSDPPQWNLATLIRARALLSMATVSHPSASFEKQLALVGASLLEEEEDADRATVEDAAWWAGPQVTLPHVPLETGGRSKPPSPGPPPSLRFRSPARFPLRLLEDARRREERLVGLEWNGATVLLSTMASSGFAFPRHGTLTMRFCWPSLPPLVSEEELEALLRELAAQPNDQERCALLRSCLHTAPATPPKGRSKTTRADGGVRAPHGESLAAKSGKSLQSVLEKDLSSDQEEEDDDHPRDRSIEWGGPVGDLEDESGEFGYLWASYGLGTRKDGVQVFFTTDMVCRILQTISFAYHKQVAASMLRRWVSDRHFMYRIHQAIEDSLADESFLQEFSFRGEGT